MLRHEGYIWLTEDGEVFRGSDTAYRGVVVAAPNVVLDQAAIEPELSGAPAEHAVTLFRAWDRNFDFCPRLTPPPGATLGAPSGCQVLGGSIKSLGGGRWSSGIYAADGDGLLVDGTTIHVAGEMSHCVFTQGGAVSLRKSKLLCGQTWRTDHIDHFKTDRSFGPAVARLPGSQETMVIVHCNLFIGGNAGLHLKYGANVMENLISHSLDSYLVATGARSAADLPLAGATNGYAGLVFEGGFVAWHHNVAVPLIGRGLIVDSAHDVSVSDSLFAALEVANLEFPADDLTACALRSRGVPGNNEFVGNRLLAIAGGPYVSAAGMFVTHCPDVQGRPYEYDKYRPSQFDGNRSVGVLIAQRSSARIHAAGMSLEGHAGHEPSQVSDTFVNNEIKSNDFVMQLDGPDEPCGTHRTVMHDRYSLLSRAQCVAEIKDFMVTAVLMADGHLFAADPDWLRCLAAFQVRTKMARKPNPAGAFAYAGESNERTPRLALASAHGVPLKFRGPHPNYRPQISTPTTYAGPLLAH